MSAKRYKVLIVEDSPVFYEPLRAEINRDGEFEVMGVTGSVREAQKLIRTGLPDVIIVDLRLSEGDGCDLLNFVRDTKDKLSILPYTVVTTTFGSEPLMDMLSDGLCDYIFHKKNLSYSAGEVLKHLRLASKYFHRNRRPGSTTVSSALEQEEMIRMRISREINQYYLNQGSPGIDYLVETIYRVIKLPRAENPPVMQLYVEVGKQYGMTANSIDNAIRRQVHAAFMRTCPEDIKRLYSPYLDIGRGVPRNKEFIVYIANKIRAELG